MKTSWLICAQLAVVLSGCGIQDAVRRNQEAVDTSTYTIYENMQAIQQSTWAIQENRRKLDEINQTLAKVHEESASDSDSDE